MASVGTSVTATHPATTSAIRAELRGQEEIAELGGSAGIDRQDQRKCERDDGEEEGADGGAVGFGPELCEGGGRCHAWRKKLKHISRFARNDKLFSERHFKKAALHQLPGVA